MQLSDCFLRNAGLVGGVYTVIVRRGDRGKELHFSNISHFIQHELIHRLLNVVYMKIHMFLN